MLLRDVDAWLREQGLALVARADLPEAVLDRVAAAADGVVARDRQIAAMYANSQHGPLQHWATDLVAGLPELALDLGCGAGLYRAPAGARVVGVDGSWTLLRRFPGFRVLSDALDPPFLPASFGAVLLFNALDSVHDPATLLAAADGLLRPGGLLALSCAFAWAPQVTPRADWMDEAALRGWLASRGYELEEEAELDWPLVVSPRTRHVHRALALRARKRARGA